MPPPAPPAEGKFGAYAERIRDLEGYGEEDGAPMKPASREDFWSFAEEEAYAREAELFLCENGNLGAIWHDGGDTQLDLEFLGAGKVKFIIFKNNNSPAKTEIRSGFDALEGLKDLIDRYGLRPLLADG